MMNLRKMSLIFSGLLMTVLSSDVSAQPCPETLPPEGDFDGDGILNKDDPCCFVAAIDFNLSADMCAPLDNNAALVDRNGNGIPASAEGMCCLWVGVAADADSSEAQLCSVAPLDTSTGAVACKDFWEMVPCDSLLLYSGMHLDPGVGGNAPVVNCQQGECICYTIEDHDSDVLLDQPLGGNRNGPFDNCPKTYNPDFDDARNQLNKDGDIWGDACDLCPGVTDTFTVVGTDAWDFSAQDWYAAQCAIDADDCPESYCVTMAFRNASWNSPDRLPPFNQPVVVGSFCATSPDRDFDGIGDACDNCPDVPNPDQADDDKDGIGNACDKDWVDTDTETDSIDGSDTDDDDDMDSEFGQKDTDKNDYAEKDTGTVVLSGGGLISCSHAPASPAVRHTFISLLFM